MEFERGKIGKATNVANLKTSNVALETHPKSKLQDVLSPQNRVSFLGLTRTPSDNSPFCRRLFSVYLAGISGNSGSLSLHPTLECVLGIHIEYHNNTRECGGDQMTREEQMKAAWTLLQEVQLDPRSYTARGRQQVRATARISCSLPADVVKRLDSLGSARSHHV